MFPKMKIDKFKQICLAATAWIKKYKQICLAITAFIIAFIFVLILNHQHMFEGEVGWFTWPSIICFSGLLVICIIEMWKHAKIAEVINEQLPLSSFKKWHENITKKNNGQYSKEIIETLIERIENIKKTKCSKFIRQLIEERQRCLERCVSDTSNTLYILEQKSVDELSASNVNVFVSFFVNALLFIGIIGTFHGLITAFSGGHVQDLVKNTNNNEALTHILGGFYKAFSTSLTAYIFFLAGRLIQDLYDSDAKALETRVEKLLYYDLTSLFSSLRSRMVLELPENVKDQISNIHNTTKITAATMETAVDRYKEINQLLMNALAQGRKEWKEAADTWKETTNAFTTAAKDLSTYVTALERKVKRAINKIDNAASRMDKSAKRIVETWENSMGVLAGELEKNVNGYHDTLNKFSGKLKEQFLYVKDTRALLERMNGDIQQSKSYLQNSIEKIITSDQQTYKRHLDVINGLSGQYESTSNSITKSLTLIRSRFKEFNDSMELLSNTFIDSEKEGDFLSVLKEIRGHLSKIELNY